MQSNMVAWCYTSSWTSQNMITAVHSLVGYWLTVRQTAIGSVCNSSFTTERSTVTYGKPQTGIFTFYLDRRFESSEVASLFVTKWMEYINPIVANWLKVAMFSKPRATPFWSYFRKPTLILSYCLSSDSKIIYKLLETLTIFSTNFRYLIYIRRWNAVMWIKTRLKFNATPGHLFIAFIAAFNSEGFGENVEFLDNMDFKKMRTLCHVSCQNKSMLIPSCMVHHEM